MMKVFGYVVLHMDAYSICPKVDVLWHQLTV